MTFHADDIKVIGANIICMIILKIDDINDELQAIMFLATIAYTVVRTISEVKKLKENGKRKRSSGKED